MQDYRTALQQYLRAQTDAHAVEIGEMSKLTGGAIQENWLLEVTFEGGRMPGCHGLVLRTDSRSAVAVSLSRAQEFAVLKVAHGAGVTVPEPLFLCQDAAVIGKDFVLMRRIAGTAAGHRLVKDESLGGNHDQLAQTLGENMARLHSIKPPHADLGFLPGCDGSPARQAIAAYRAFLDSARDPHPVMEWGLRWCELNAPAKEEVTLIHRDFRTGNYMVDGNGLTGILDWEFAAWGNPLEDLGWFCSKAWRFGQYGRAAGGIATLEPFLRGYCGVSGRAVTAADLRYWEVMASLRWAVIAIQQGERHLSGEEPSLELALTGRIPAELELEILLLTSEKE